MQTDWNGLSCKSFGSDEHGRPDIAGAAVCIIGLWCVCEQVAWKGVKYWGFCGLLVHQMSAPKSSNLLVLKFLSILTCLCF